MIQVHSLKSLLQTEFTGDGMFSDRRRQFVDRHRWELTVDGNGCELDEYDTDDATYIVKTDSDGRHVGSLRMRWVHDGNMIEDHFGSQFEFDPMGHRKTIEVTRFCRSPSSNASEEDISSALLEAAYLHAFGIGSTRLIGLCFTPTLRLYNRIGCTPQIRTRSKTNSHLYLTEWDVSFSGLLKVMGRHRVDEKRNTHDALEVARA